MAGCVEESIEWRIFDGKEREQENYQIPIIEFFWAYK